jgi:protein SCO1/2
VKRVVLYAAAALVLLNLAALVYFLFRAPPAGRSVGNGPATGESPGQPGVYSVTGVVRELRPDGSNVVIRHEAIPGFMMAMTMPFTARDPREVAGLNPGDKVTFRLLVTDDQSWIDSVNRIAPSVAPEPAFDYAQSRIVRDVEPLSLGDVMPDYVFTNQFGNPFRLSDLRGNALGLTFIFTRCPLPEFCPRMLRNFSAVAQSLKAQSNGATNWHLVTVTIDPAFDTPAVLRTYAERNNYNPAHWTFITGALIDIDALTEQVGLMYRRQAPNALPDHNLRTLLIDPNGRLQKIIIGNTWRPEELAQDMLTVARGGSLPE